LVDKDGTQKEGGIFFMRRLSAVILFLLLLPSVAFATVAASTSTITHNCTGTTGPFTFTFNAGSESEIQVIQADADGDETPLSGYTVTCINDECFSGGTVTLGTACPSGSTVTILRDVDLTQETDFTDGMPALYETFETSLDKQIRIDQQLQEQLNRVVTLPATSIAGIVDTELPPPGAGKLFGYNGNGDGFALYDQTRTVQNIDALAVDDMNELKSTVGSYAGQIATVAGYYTKGDGAGGPLRVWISGAAAGTYVDNGGSIRVPTGGDGSAAWVSPDIWRWSVEEFGAKGDGTHDDGQEINLALANSKFVNFNHANYGTTVKITVPSGANIVGIGGGQYPAAPYASSANFISTPKSRILALAGFPSGTPVVEVKTADNALYTHQNVRIRGLMIDCANVADYGLNVVSVKNSRFEDILVYLPVLVGIIEDNLPTAVAVTEGNSATQFNVWQNVVSWTGNTGSAIGWQQLGNNINDVNQCTYIGCGTVTADGDGIQIKQADTNTWIMLHTYNFGAGKGVRLYGSDDASAPFAYAHGNIFYNPIFAGNHHSGTAQTGSANTITLTAGASSSDSIYVGRQIVITALTGLGQRRIVSGYNGTTKIATVSQSWSTQPDSTSGYTVYAGGLAAQAGTTTNSQRNAIFGLGYGSGPIIVDPGATFAYDPPLHIEGIYTQLFTPAITFITPGDLSVSYAVAAGRYWLRGNLCKFVIDLTFTPTYTTASSNFQITGLPFQSMSANRGAAYHTASVSSSDTTWTFGTSKTQIAGRIVAGGSYIRLIGLGSGVLNAFCGVAEFPSGTAKTLHIEGEYEVAN
jgi:hypothetical protein